MKKVIIIFFVIIFIILGLSFINNNAHTKALSHNSKLRRAENDTSWVDSVFNSLTLEQRIAQLFIIRACSNTSQADYDKITKLITDYNIGGICFFKGNPTEQAKLTNYWQSKAKTPLFIAIDAEWGLGMRLHNTMSFPRQMTLGAIQNDSLIYEMAVEIARQCKRLNININFAPVVDVNSNPDNPVINSRSFGQDKYNVAKKGLAYMQGLQDNKILAVAKHFPGHGDTDKDSHKTLPVINNSKQRIDSVDLYPFKMLINNKLKAIMVAHLFIPAYDSTKNTPTTLSKTVVTELLKEKLGFKGLVITDALEMKGVTDNNKPGEIEVKALMAGNDILLLPQDVPVAIDAIKKAMKKGLTTEKQINETCKKILAAKKWAGLNNYKPVKIKDIYNDINRYNGKQIQKKLYETSVTLLKNNNDLIPLKRFDTLKMAVLSIGTNNINNFQRQLCNYAKFDNYNISKNPTTQEKDTILSKLQKYNLIIIGIHNTNNSPKKNFGITQQTIDIINSIKTKQKIVLDIFANPYSLSMLKHTKNIESLIISYQDNETSEIASAKMIMGIIPAKGKLPVTGSVEFPVNSGLKTVKKKGIDYSILKKINISPKILYKIDSIALNGINEKAYPGCQILAAKDGKIFYQKTFGYHTYENIIPVKNNDIYDLASLTKVVATTLAIMKLYDQGKIDINAQLGKYLPCLAGTNKEHIIIKDIMTHQARLESWIPFYENTIVNCKLNDSVYSKSKSSLFPYRVADSIYIRKDYPDTIISKIIKTHLYKKTKYKYSDMGFYLLMKVVESISGETLDNYVKNNFYKPMALNTICYEPRKYFPLSRIVPTENDIIFRHQLIHGDVHDPGAAMMGGVCGHAGLFSDAYDLAMLMQMLLQNGTYKGHRYINEATVKMFTKYQFPENDNRRGLGFDKPIIKGEGGPACKSASENSFGHSGFTGTYIWADPDENLVFIFLSNRVYPDASNRKLLTMSTRTNIHQVIYNSIVENVK